jgi:hypothetical protein
LLNPVRDARGITRRHPPLLLCPPLGDRMQQTRPSSSLALIPRCDQSLYCTSSASRRLLLSNCRSSSCQLVLSSCLQLFKCNSPRMPGSRPDVQAVWLLVLRLEISPDPALSMPFLVAQCRMAWSQKLTWLEALSRPSDPAAASTAFCDDVDFECRRDARERPLMTSTGNILCKLT